MLLGWLLLALLGAASPSPRADTETRWPAALLLESPGEPARVIDWFVSEDPYDLRALRRWRAAVGPPVIRELAPPDHAATPLDSLIVISWNIHVGGGDLDRFILELRRGSFTGGEPPEHFVILLQEAYRRGTAVPESPPDWARSAKAIFAGPDSGLRLSIDKLACKHDLALFYAPAMRNGKPGQGSTAEDRGNAILSSLPLADYTVVELPAERQRRVTLGASLRGRSLDGEDWNLVLVNMHLENRTPLRKWLESFGEARLRQIRFALDLLPEHTPSVCGGDFNTWFRQDKAAVTQFARQRFPLPRELPPGGTSEMLPGWLRRIDYLLFNVPEPWSAGYRRMDHRHGSDHFPLLGWIRFSRPAALEGP